MKKNLYTVISVFFMLLIIIADICYMTINASDYLTKTITSSLFVLCGIFNFIYCIKTNLFNNKPYKYLMLPGLIFGALGDILLIEYFIIGAALFAVGHIFYIIAYFSISRFNYKDIAVSSVIIAFALTLISVYNFNFNGMLPLVVVYAVIISIMLGKATTIIFNKDFDILTKCIIIAGSLLFFFSDLMLLFNVFGPSSRVFGVLCLATYYPAQFLLGTSIYFVSKNGSEKSDGTTTSVRN